MMTTRLYFHDDDDGQHVEFGVEAEPDDVHNVLRIAPANVCSSVQAAMIWFIRAVAWSITIEGIPCDSAEQWLDEFVDVGDAAIAWDPMKGNASFGGTLVGRNLPVGRITGRLRREDGNA
jgi:hypothetical protein